MCISKLSYEEEATIFTALCPITYRGYNYDFTTGLYYLQSRYYNPEWGRFLNCDDTAILLATQGETHNANLFAYCANNPVNWVDYTGFFKAKDHYDYSAGIAINLFGVHYGSVLAQGSMDVDTLYSPVRIYSKYDQGFHFNVNKSGTDSRDERTQELCRSAWKYVDEAIEYKKKGVLDLYRTHIENAFYLFGQALHPQQDKIAHSGKTGDITIGIGVVSFHMHLLKDDDPQGVYYHPILQTYMTKHEAVQIDTWFLLVLIYSGLIQRGVDVKELQKEPSHVIY